MNNKLRGPIKCHGGKWYLKDFVISHFPPNYEHLDYIEPFVGGGSIFLNKKPSVGIHWESISDIDYNIICLWKTIKYECEKFQNILSYFDYKEETFLRALNTKPKDKLSIAIREFIVRRMSRGGLGKNFAWSNRQRGGKPGDVNAWETAIKNLSKINKRLKPDFFNTWIEHTDAINQIQKFNDYDILIYCDPPYLQSTRTCKNIYEYEFSEGQHIQLAQTLNNCKSKIIISGYPSPLYYDLYKDWNFYTKSIANHSGQTKTKNRRNECIWTNY
jgi:DNA adenine methylase